MAPRWTLRLVAGFLRPIRPLAIDITRSILRWLDRLAVTPRPVRWLAVALWCGLIYYFTATPDYTGSGTLGLLARLLPFVPAPVLDLLNFLIRKAAHLAAFGTLALLTRWALPPAPWAGPGAWAFTTLYAATDEWHQTLVPGRSGTLGDVLLDSAGALVALLALGLWARRRRRRF